ncbi:MAG: DUF4258 domain-containing protein [Nitrospirae bacterium]|nr:DUF4258 domain-containing protein [Nitrospirota bacterium]
MNINDIIESIRNGKIRITDHADEEAQADNLSFKEILSSVQIGEIIEQYPKDKPYPSCLILGRNLRNEPIHSVWAYNSETEASVLITVYRPDPLRWMEDFKTRRKQ